MKSWKLSELKFIRENLHLTDAELAKHFGIKKDALHSTRQRHGIFKGSGFKKGHTPFNKGRRLEETHSKEGIKNSSVTRFKKGQKPVNHNRAMYEVYEGADGTGRLSTFIKVPWKIRYYYSWYVYEQHTGDKVKKGELIRFKDGNMKNFDPSNLIKITRAENLKMNANRSKGAASLKSTWAVVRTFEDFGLTAPFKFKTKRKAS